MGDDADDDTGPVVEPVDPAVEPEHRPGPGRAGRHRGLVVAGAIGVAIVVLVAGWFVFGGDRVREATEDEARQRLDSGTTVTTTSGTEPTSPLAGPPLQGVYRFEGSGREETSFPPLTEEQGPTMPATVTAQPDGCWILRIDYSSHHWQDWTYCTGDGQLIDRGGSAYSRRSVGTLDIENTSTFTCDPAVIVVDATDEPGGARDRSCVGTGSLLPDPTTVSGTTTNVGRETLEVGGSAIETVHVRDDLTYSGAQTGTETTDAWFDLATGLPVRNEHQILAITDTPVGQITYTESSQYQLTDLRPV